MSALSIIAPPTGRLDLRAAAWSLRGKLGLHDEPYVPIMHVIERLLTPLTGFTFLPKFKEEMGENHGLTLLDEKEMWLREDVYEGACDGLGRDRMTAAHELGHVLLHGRVTLARRLSQEVRTYEDPEWQAKCFAGELLISVRHISACRTIKDAARLFGVSEDAVRQQCRAFAKEGIQVPTC